MGTFHSLSTEQIGKTVIENIEIYGSVIMIKEERVIKSCGFSRILKVLIFAEYTVEDLIRKYTLLLLPPCFPVMPCKTVEVFSFKWFTLHNVVPAESLDIHPDFRHLCRYRLGKLNILVLGGITVYPHKVPCDL